MKTFLKSCLVLILSISFFSTKIYAMTDDEIEAAANNSENDNLIISEHIQPLFYKCNGNINKVFLEICENSLKNEMGKNLTGLSLRALKLLLDIGVNINYSATTNLYTTGLHEAITEHQVEIAIFLINNHANLNIKSVFGYTPLMLAIIYNQKRIAKLLINAGADLEIKDDNENTALMHATRHCIQEIVEMLIDAGTDLDKQDKNGETALIKASSFNAKEIFKILINAGANLELSDKHNETALDIAKNKDYVLIIEMINNANTKK